MIGSFLRTAKAYTEEGRLCIRAASDFAKGMIDTPETLTVIGATVASLTGQKYEILVELGAGDAQANDDIIDEILETAEEL